MAIVMQQKKIEIGWIIRELLRIGQLCCQALYLIVTIINTDYY